MATSADIFHNEQSLRIGSTTSGPHIAISQRQLTPTLPPLCRPLNAPSCVCPATKGSSHLQCLHPPRVTPALPGEVSSLGDIAACRVVVAAQTPLLLPLGPLGIKGVGKSSLVVGTCDARTDGSAGKKTARDFYCAGHESVCAGGIERTSHSAWGCELQSAARGEVRA